MAKERSPATKTCSTTEPNFVRDYLRGKGNTKELRFSDCKVMVEEGEGWVRKQYVKEDYAWDQETFGGGDGNDEGPVEAAEERLQEIRERYALRRAVLSLQGDRAARARRVGQRGMGNASARQLVRPEPAQPSRRLRRLRVAAAD